MGGGNEDPMRRKTRRLRADLREKKKQGILSDRAQTQNEQRNTESRQTTNIVRRAKGKRHYVPGFEKCGSDAGKGGVTQKRWKRGRLVRQCQKKKGYTHYRVG